MTVITIFCGALSLGSYFCKYKKVYIKIVLIINLYISCADGFCLGFFFLSQSMKQYRMPYSLILMTRALGSTTGGCWEGVRLIRGGRVCCGGVILKGRG